ncbi:GGDEF domain-containing protein [Spartinivicinus ruber]|uniref:GGDEF domain-containing protein n=1 Tax=Spartinivicinus ruber TaxID=2683272 RepID=UPI0013D2B2FA|nr:GGDEF domain-containing protein [Spartinivicinus ruber]
MQSTSAADKSKNSNIKLITPLPAKGKQHSSTESQLLLKIRLMNRLQNSLEVERVLTAFFHEIQTHVTTHGLNYVHNELNINVSVGEQSYHSCNYRLITDNEAVGEITFRRQQRFQEEELATIEGLLGCLVYPLRNALQYQLAVTTSLKDPLTGAGNRIAFDNAIKRELNICRREEQPLSLLMIDIDHFKNINDSYGHPAGDYILKKAVDCLQQSLRNVDMTFRFGGEEFVILLSKTNLISAELVAERLRENIAAMQCHYNGQSIPVTISIGTAMFSTGDSIFCLLERADKALYQAKNQGRNKVCAIA